MFNPIQIPFGCVMLFNVVDLKPGVTVEDVELVLGEMCNVVKTTTVMTKVDLLAVKSIAMLDLFPMRVVWAMMHPNPNEFSKIWAM